MEKLYDELEVEPVEEQIEEDQLEEEQIVEEPALDEPEAEPEPEEPKEEPKEAKRVPLGELIDERKRRQAAEKEAQEQQKKLDLILEKLKEQEAKNVVPEVEFETDPFGYTLNQQEKIHQRAEEAYTETEQLKQQFQQYVQFNQAAAVAEKAISDFKSQKPDYDAARQYLYEVNKKALITQGFTPEDAEDSLNTREREVNAMLVMQGQNPAEVLYQYAEIYGYKPNITAEKESNNEDDGLNRLEKGQKYAKVGSSGGATSKKDVDLDSSMEFEEFQAAFKEIFG